MQVLRLAEGDCHLLAARFREHGNSVRRMTAALREAGSPEGIARLRALRGLERRFAVDLGSLCHKYLRRDDPEVHPLERRVLGWLARHEARPDGTWELTILLDRLRQIRELLAGRTPPRVRPSAEL